MYEWQNGEFVEISYHAPNSLGIPFDEAFTLAETLIFEEHDYATAVSTLNVILNELDPDDWRARRLPEMLYFLGLAHELQGQEDEAVAAYWQLWHDYPTDPYALMSLLKKGGIIVDIISLLALGTKTCSEKMKLIDNHPC